MLKEIKKNKAFKTELLLRLRLKLCFGANTFREVKRKINKNPPNIILPPTLFYLYIPLISRSLAYDGLNLTLLTPVIYNTEQLGLLLLPCWRTTALKCVIFRILWSNFLTC